MDLFKQSIIQKYLQKELIYFWVAISCIFFFLIFFNQLFLVFNESLDIPLSVSEIFTIIFLKTFTDLPILASISLLISITIVFSRLTYTSEIFILATGGVGKLNIAKNISFFMFLVLFLVSFQTFFLNPNIEKKINSLRDFASQDLTRFSFRESIFNYLNNDSYMVFLTQKDLSDQNKDEIFKDFHFFADEKDSFFLVSGHKALKQNENGETFFQVIDGEKILLEKNLNSKQATKFDSLKINISNLKPKNFNKSEDQDTRTLIDLLNNIGVSKNDSELFWRLSLSFNVLIFTLFAVSIFTMKPRNSNSSRFISTIIFLVTYLTIILSLKSLILESYISFFQGTMFFSILLSMFFLIFMFNSISGVNKKCLTSN